MSALIGGVSGVVFAICVCLFACWGSMKRRGIAKTEQQSSTARKGSEKRTGRSRVDWWRSWRGTLIAYLSVPIGVVAGFVCAATLIAWPFVPPPTKPSGHFDEQHYLWRILGFGPQSEGAKLVAPVAFLPDKWPLTVRYVVTGPQPRVKAKEYAQKVLSTIFSQAVTIGADGQARIRIEGAHQGLTWEWRVQLRFDETGGEGESIRCRLAFVCLGTFQYANQLADFGSFAEQRLEAAASAVQSAAEKLANDPAFSDSVRLEE